MIHKKILTTLLLIFNLAQTIFGYSSPVNQTIYNHNPPPPKTNTPIKPRNEDNSYRGSVEVDFLYWASNFSNLSYGIKFTNPAPGTSQVPLKKLRFDSPWKSGVRVGVGLTTPHDRWRIFSNWTYYYASESAENRGGTNVFAQGTTSFTTPWIVNPNFDQFVKLDAKYAVQLNQINLLLQKNISLSTYFSSQMNWGLKGYWSRLFLSVNAFRPLIPSEQNLIDEYARHVQKAWGVGFVGEVENIWHITQNWGLVCQGGAALAYGRSFIKSKSTLFQIQAPPAILVRELDITTYDIFYRLQSFIDLGAGFRYAKTFKNNISAQFDVLWEFHFLYHFNQLPRGITEFEYSADFFPSNGNFNLTGLVVRGKIEF